MNQNVRLVTHLLSLVLAGCGGSTGDAVPDGPPSQGDSAPGSGAGGEAPVPTPDPADRAVWPWAPPEEPAVTVDVGDSLEAVLERNALSGSCERYRQGATDRETLLKCGKWMFFQETFGTQGIPYALLAFLQKHYANTFYGPGFSQLGFIPDPSSADGMPIGLSDTTAKLGFLSTKAFTCAACHFGRLEDGRYVVGLANHDLDYGLFLTSLGAPISLSTNEDDPAVHPSLRERLAGPVAEAKKKPLYMLELGALGAQLLAASGGKTFSPSVEEQGQLLGMPKGTMDFMGFPLTDDGVFVVGRLISLFNIPSQEQERAAGMPNALLSWNGAVPDVMTFLHGFAVVSAGDVAEWSDDRLRPLEAYVRHLRPPPPPGPGRGDPRVLEGARHFVTRGCLECHGGPSGEGTRVFMFSEVGTDAALSDIYAPSSSGEPCCGIARSNITHGVKAPRLAGLWAQKRLLHNGVLSSLEELCCLELRPEGRGPALGSEGHRMTCDGLEDTEKRDLITYLRTL